MTSQRVSRDRRVPTPEGRLALSRTTGLPAAIVFLLATLALPGCGPPASRPDTEPFRVAAAADLQTVLPELVDAFERTTSARRPELVFNASGQLARQLAQGAPVDLFLSADRRYVDDLVAQGIIDAGSARDYTQGALCLVVHAAAGGVVHQLADLDDAKVGRVAIANPETAPYGRAAKQALVAAGLWDRLEPKIVFAENVRQAYQYVQSGNAEAGLVGCSIAPSPGVLRIAIDPTLHDPIIQRLGRVRDSRHSADARAFSDFLLTPEARKIFLDHGFRPCPDSSEANGTSPRE